MSTLRKIVTTGPESSGKSHIAKELSQQLHCPWIPEYARIYLERHGPEYDYPTVLELAMTHKQHQEGTLLKHPDVDLVLLDTDLLTYEVWCEVVFGKCHPWISEKLKSEDDHRYLLCYPDLPWEEDPLRENPDNRLELFELYKSKLDALSRPYRILKGSGEKRLQNALAAVEELMEN